MCPDILKIQNQLIRHDFEETSQGRKLNERTTYFGQARSNRKELFSSSSVKLKSNLKQSGDGHEE
jgi:hypothetical protein